MSKKTLLFFTLLLLSLTAALPSSGKSEAKDKITVACYYFPNYHSRSDDELPVSEQNPTNWNEWELIKAAKPRFEGHDQPKVPLWGYQDESDPKAMAQKIEAAYKHGIDAFIFDWYTYEGRPFLNGALDEGFLKAKNTKKLKFSLMWANHDWLELYPHTAGTHTKMLYGGCVSSEMFDKIGDDLVKQYFTKPNYWLIDGKAYFSIYDIQNFIKNFGSVEATVAEMKKLNEKAIKAGLKGVHWNLVAWSHPILPGQQAPSSIAEVVKKLNFDSTTSYVWIHHAGMSAPTTDFNSVRDTYMRHWDSAKKAYGVQYYPNVTMGWDSSPRTNQNKGWSGQEGYPYTPVMVNNTPANFKKALQMTKDKLLADPNGPRIMNINCWNEWTEGSYLEPDIKNGMGYLEAVRDVFKTSKK